jgi:hypothetical protein
MVHNFKRRLRQDPIDLLSVRVRLETRQEWTCVVNSLNEGVGSVSIGLDTRDDDSVIVILESLWGSNTLSSPLNCDVVYSGCVIDLEGHVFNSISMLFKLLGELYITRVQRGGKCKHNL